MGGLEPRLGQIEADQNVAPEIRHLDESIDRLEQRRDGLHAALRERDAWLVEHAEGASPLELLNSELNPRSEI